MRIPAGSSLKSRIADTTIDARTVNGVLEGSKDGFGVLKRGGVDILGSVTSGTSQGLVGGATSALAVTNDSAKELTPYPFNVNTTYSLTPIFAGLDFTASCGLADFTKPLGGPLLIKTVKEAWVVT